VAIDSVLVEGRSRLELARQHSLAESSVRRHAENHLPRDLQDAVTEKRATEARTLLERVEAIVGDLEEMAAAVKLAKEPREFRESVRELMRGLELLGKVTGEIQTGATINVAVGVLARIGAKDEDEARRALEMVREVEHLDVHDIAREAAKRLKWYRDKFPNEYRRLVELIPDADVAPATTQEVQLVTPEIGAASTVNRELAEFARSQRAT
jgi:hypothetical protein